MQLHRRSSFSGWLVLAKYVTVGDVCIGQFIALPAPLSSLSALFVFGWKNGRSRQHCRLCYRSFCVVIGKFLQPLSFNPCVNICPAGEELPHQRNVIERGLEQKVYVNFYHCRDCDVRDKCTTSAKEPRKMKRWIYHEEIVALQQRLDDYPMISVLRRQTVAHPFGTINMWMGAQHFLIKRKKNVSIEMSLHVLAYKLKRMMNIMGTTGLMEAIRQ